MKQPIAFNHPDYAIAYRKWKRCRDACSGSDAIKAGGVEYLPALSAHKKGPEGQEKYSAYLTRALWFNASKRTMLGLSGAANLRPAKVTTTDEFAADVANRILRLRYKLTEEQLKTGRTFLLCSITPDNIPYTTFWWAESIVNWGFKSHRGEYALDFIVLEDTESTGSILNPDSVTVRHLYYMKQIGESVEQSICYYQKWQKEESKEEEWIQVGDELPLIAAGGRPIDFIPGLMVNALDVNEPDIEDPVLLDLVDVNISHYQNSADLEHGRHWTALPTAYASGFPTVDKDNNAVEFNVGGESAWITDIPGATCGYLEFSGSGLGHLQAGMESKERMMAVLGSRLLEEAKAVGEAAETIKTRLTGEKSILSRIAANTSEALTRALHISLWLSTLEYPIGNDAEAIKLNTDFLVAMSPSELQTLTATLQAGAISYQTYFSLLQNADIIPQDRTLEEEIAMIDAGKAQFQPLDPFMGEPTEEDAAEPEEATAEDTEEQTQEPATEEPAQEFEVTFNELTLGVERLVRAGNTEGANALLKEAAKLLSLKSLGKVSKAPTSA